MTAPDDHELLDRYAREGSESAFADLVARHVNVSSRHNGGANVLFCDSHVEFGKRATLIKEEDRPRRRWNIDHEPHPEFW